jgi:hypothetical protein
MRRVLVTLLAAFAVLALTANLAAGANKPAAHPAAKCGGLYQPPCIGPTVIARSAVACRNTGAVLRFPVSVHAIAGLAKATAKYKGKVIKSITFHGNPQSGHFTVVISTRGNKPGLFTLTLHVTDVRGKSASRTVHFTICRPKPVFTG